MELKVIVGPACSRTLRDDIEASIARLSERNFTLTSWIRHDFRDREFLAQIGESVRGADVYIVQATNPPEENFRFLQQMLQAASLASAARVTAVLPYMGGLRQDRKDRPRVGISASQYAEEIETAMQAASQRHVMIFHPHFPQVQGFFRISSDLLYPTELFKRKLAEFVANDFSGVVPVAPDVGAAKLAEIYAKELNTESFAIGDKRRDSEDHIVIRDIVGGVAGKVVFVVDDILDTARTMKKLVLKLHEKRVRKSQILVFATHGILVRGAIENLQSAGVRRVIITDSVRHSPARFPKELFSIVRCGGLIGEAIYRNHTDRSIVAIAGQYK